MDSGDVRSVNVEEERGAWTVMCVSHDIIVAQHASPSQTPRLVRPLTLVLSYCTLTSTDGRCGPT